MSGARTVEGGETKWSKCSADKLKRFNKACVYQQEEGEDDSSKQLKQQLSELTAVTAAEQCQLFLKDEEAVVVENVCSSLLCSSKKVIFL